MKHTVKFILTAAALLVLAAVSADAQVGKRWYINAGWQFNATPGNGYSECTQGWGGYAEGCSRTFCKLQYK